MPILGCQSCAYCGCRWTYGMLELNSACHAVPLYKLPQLWLICVAILLCPLWVFCANTRECISWSSKFFWWASPLKDVVRLCPGTLLHILKSTGPLDMNLLKSLEPTATLAPHRLLFKIRNKSIQFRKSQQPWKATRHCFVHFASFCCGPRLHLPFGQTRGFALSKSRGRG